LTPALIPRFLPSLRRASTDHHRVVADTICPICDGRSFRFLFIKNGRRFWECEECRVQQIIPLPSDEEVQQHYRASYENGLYRTQLDTLGIHDRRAEERLEAVLPLCRPGRWLDVGCSEGDFVATAQRYGLDAEGIDLCEIAVARARTKGLPVSCASVSDLRPSLLYDTITAFDVIEHVRDPASFLTSIWSLLGPGGSLVLTTPDLSSWSRLVMRRRWYFYIPEEHLFHFRRDSLCRLLSRTRFDVVKVMSASKLVSYAYALDQLKEYNPLVHALATRARALIPKAMVETPFPLHLGELLVIARKQQDGA